MNIQPYLPSKKIQVVIGALLLIGLGYVGYLAFKKSPSDSSSRFLDVEFINEETRLAMLVDSDNDGLYDWEELLWELDPHDPYSNGNGILDSKYVEQRQLNELPRYGQNIPESNLTETEKLGRSLYTALLSIGVSGENLDEISNDRIVQNVENYIGNLTFGNKVYLREDFHRVSNTKAHSQNYRTAMTSLFSRYPVTRADLELLLLASEIPEEYQSSVNVTARKYKNYLDTLLSIEVPTVVVGRHVELANNISQLEAAFSNLLVGEQDEVIIISSFVQLDQIINNTAEAILRINVFFEMIEDSSLFIGEEWYEDEGMVIEG